MPSFFKNNIFLISISAILSGVAFTNMFYFLLFVSIIPVFYVMNKTSTKKNIAFGFIFGTVLGAVFYYWMLEAFGNYTDGKNIGLAIGFITVSILVKGVFYALIFGCVSFLWKMISLENKKQQLLQLFAIASVWVLLEALIPIVFKAYPFHSHQLGTVFAKNLFTIQWASIGGVDIFTFFVILVNVFLAKTVIKKEKFYVKGALITLFVLFLGGFLIKKTFTPNKTKDSFKVSSVSGNFSTKNFWSQNKVNQLAEDYFQLINDVNKEIPDFVVFPESALPWTYYGNDDLLNEFHKRINPKTALIIGLNSTKNSKDTIVKNKVFYFKNSKVLGEYQKEILIKGLETPIADLVAPFAHNTNYIVEKANNNNDLLKTPFGKAGVLICNESIVVSHGIQQTQKGANFFFNTSNDSWFKETYIAKQHFYQSRLLSVITRKDMVISNNAGYNAIIKSSGKILKSSKKDYKTIITGNLQPNNNTSFKIKIPYFFNMLLAISIAFCLLISLKNKKLKLTNIKSTTQL